MPKVARFKGPGNQVIPIYYSAASRLFSATFSGEKYEKYTQKEIEQILKRLTTYQFSWIPVIDITVNLNSSWGGLISLSYDRYYVSPYFDTWRESEWGDFSEKHNFDYRDGRSSNIRIEKFNVPYHNVTKGRHIIEYDGIFWDNLVRLEKSLIEVRDRINHSFADSAFLGRMKSLNGVPLPELAEGVQGER